MHALFSYFGKYRSYSLIKSGAESKNSSGSKCYGGYKIPPTPLPNLVTPLQLTDAMILIEHRLRQKLKKRGSDDQFASVDPSEKEQPKKEKEEKTRHIDPITLAIISPEDDIDVNGVHYNIISLYLYLSRTDHFRDPIGGEMLSESQIKMIDMRYAQSSTDVQIDFKNEGGADKDEKRSSESSLTEKYINCTGNTKKDADVNALQSWDSICGETITEIYNLVEKDAKTTIDDFDFRLSVLMSEFEFPFYELKTLDSEAAILSLSSYKSFLRGPIKKPTKDPNLRLSNWIFPALEALLTDDDKERNRQSRSSSWDEGHNV